MTQILDIRKKVKHYEMLRHFNPLQKKIEHYSLTDQALIRKAFDFAAEAHKGQKRQSGEDYITHPVAVASILADMHLDACSIVAGLLHDTVEDTTITIETIQKEFGSDIAGLVQGVTKLSKIELKSHETKQAENFRKLVLAMSEDIRVLLIKLGDRLHNMRTLAHKKSPESRARTALETMEIYAPLAERIGMHSVQEELLNLAFKELNADAYESIVTRLSRLHVDGEKVINTVVEDLKKTLFSVGVIGEVYGRQKSPYSIWHKMRHKNVPLEQLSDVMAFRILVNSIADCYQALGAIHSHYVVLPGRFKDYIGTPKSNHYQSLHTAVIGPQQRPIEIQIRTYEMHTIAEYGVAAHWEYKQASKERSQNGPEEHYDKEERKNGKDGRQYRWLRNLLDILDTASGPEEFLEHTKLEMYQDQVFCFTPRGEILTLPKGATCIDFAYAVHSDVGNKCTGAKVNGRLVPLRTELSNGDQVEVITNPQHEPSPAWEQFVVTGRARSSIRRYVRLKKRSQFITLGTLILEKAFAKDGRVFEKQALIPTLSRYRCQEADDLLFAVGNGHYTGQEIVHSLFHENLPRSSSVPLAKSKTLRRKKEELEAIASVSNSPISIKELIPGIAIHYAKCCNPLPGDKIIGIRVKGKGLTIHTLGCHVLDQYADKPERLEDAFWNETEGFQFTGRIKISAMNRPGNLGMIGTIIGSKNCNIRNLSMVSREVEFGEVLCDLEVQSLEQLESIMANLRACPAVTKVERI